MITLLSAILTDVVLISMVRRDLVKIKIEHGSSVLELIRRTIEKKHENKENNLICGYPALSSEIDGIITKTQIEHVLLFCADTRRQFFGKMAEPSVMEQMIRFANNARQSGKKQIHWKGRLSDILWGKKKHR